MVNMLGKERKCEKYQETLAFTLAYMVSFLALLNCTNAITNLVSVNTGLDTLVCYAVLLGCVSICLWIILNSFSDKKKCDVFLLVIGLIVIYVISYMRPNNAMYMKSALIDYTGNPIYILFVYSVPGYIFARYLVRYDYLQIWLRRFSYAVVLLSVITHFFAPESSANQYMTISYNMLLQTLFLIMFPPKKLRFLHWALIGLGIYVIAFGGARGALLGLIIGILLMIFVKDYSRKRKKLYIVLLGTAVVLMLIMYDEILFLLRSVMDQFNIESRTFDLLFFSDGNIVFDSGRSRIISETFAGMNSWGRLFGQGIFGDRVILGGTYAHNLFVELLVDYGYVIGGALSVLVVVLIVAGLVKIKNPEWDYIALFIPNGFVALMLSGSYLNQAPCFYILLGLCVNSLIRVKKQEGKENNMKILQINSVYAKGSTGKIAKCIQDICNDKGIICKSAYSYAENGINYENTFTISTWLDCHIHNRLARWTMLHGCFSYMHTKAFLRKIELYSPDIIHLHNLHGSYINIPLLFRYIKKNKVRVVWTLHDCWAMTGQCSHFTMVKCNKWRTGCYDCPQWRHDPITHLDSSKWMYRQKKKWFTGVQDMTIVTPSLWLADLVKESYLKDYPVKVIYNGIDLRVFKPTSSDFRDKYGLRDKHIVLGVAAVWSERKGFDVFVELARRLPKQYQIVLVGTDGHSNDILPENIIFIHRTQNQVELAEIYTAAELFVNPTREEVLGMVNIEALACGTPVLTFCTGGSPEIPDETCGSVVDCDDVDAMEKEIIRICEEKPFSKEACLERAESFDMNERFKEYVKLYEDRTYCARSTI